MTIDPLKRAPPSLLIICLQEVVFSIAHSFFFLLKWSAIVLQNCLQEEIWFYVSLSLSQGYIFTIREAYQRWGNLARIFFLFKLINAKTALPGKSTPSPPKKTPHVSVYLFHSDFLKTITLMPLDAATVNVSRNPFC